MEFAFSTSVGKKEIAEIEAWLIEDEKTYHEGFYCNWNLISSAIAKHEIFIVRSEKETVGFLVWQRLAKIVNYSIMEIHPGWRGNRAGSYLAACASDHFRSQDVLVAHVECNPPSSEGFWRRQGFTDFPVVSDGSHDFIKDQLRLYCPLVPALPDITVETMRECIEIWDVEPHRALLQPPRWRFEVEYEGDWGRLAKPVIHPCYKDWHIRWRKGDTVFQQCKAAKFIDGEYHQDNFITIQELPVELPM